MVWTHSLCMRFPAWPALFCGHSLIVAGYRREWDLGDHGPPSAAVACPSRSCSPRFRMPGAWPRQAWRTGWRGGRGGGRFATVRVDGRVARLARMRTLRRRDPGVRRPGPVAANTVTVRDSKRFGEPLALPTSCPPYLREQWISRTHDRMLWCPSSSARTCGLGRSGRIFSQVSAA